MVLVNGIPLMPDCCCQLLLQVYSSTGTVVCAGVVTELLLGAVSVAAVVGFGPGPRKGSAMGAAWKGVSCTNIILLVNIS